MLLIAAIGKMRQGPERELVTRYRTRIRPRLEITELSEARGALTEKRRQEGSALLHATRGNYQRVALDEGGTVFDSIGFAAAIDKILSHGKGVAFLIGGAEGLDQAALDECALKISFGRMTWPHMMVRCMLAEQLYRARSISSGHPYHRATRP
ncbi:Ribosomal RNA large subunit methyltransferase H [Acetobacteraceae bacterium EV16G]|uniref:Ribosomal RNA large subunit methyltransferase H n=1 Tax=Sorlinia euscelidii TaxID=3081148 RepID=A0ABU7TZL7_9PROT